MNKLTLFTSTRKCLQAVCCANASASVHDASDNARLSSVLLLLLSLPSVCTAPQGLGFCPFLLATITKVTPSGCRHLSRAEAVVMTVFLDCSKMAVISVFLDCSKMAVISVTAVPISVKDVHY